MHRDRNDPTCQPPGHQQYVPGMSPSPESLDHTQKAIARAESEHACFASHASFGILDLGASKTVIGSDNVAELIQSLDSDIRRQLTRCPCNITFKFGNQATLTSQQALVIPIGFLKLKVAIVNGGTPFLISNTLMRTMSAKIDCARQVLSSKLLNQPVPLHLTAKGLFLMDMNALIRAAMDKTPSHLPDSTTESAETFVSDETEKRKPDSHPTQKLLTTWFNKAGSQVQGLGLRPIRNEHASENVITPEESTTAISQPPHDHNTLEHPMPAECQQADKVDPITTQSVRTFQHVAVSDTPSPRDTGASDLAQPRSPHTGGTGNRDNSLWTEVQGTPAPGHLARPGMDSVHGVTLPEQQQRRTPKVSEVRGTSGHRHRAGFGHGSDQQPDCDRAQSKTQSEAHGREHRHSFWHLFAGWGKRMGHGLRDVRASDYEPGANANDEGHGSSATATAEHGECNDPGHPLHGEQGEHHEPHAGGGRGLVRDDWSDDVLTTMHHETSTVFQLVSEFSRELQQALRDTKPLGTRWVLGEVMCSPNSPLTHQVQQGGKSAFRHGLAQGDLSTQPGRMGLFQSVARHRPKHIWYSPVCGPWSSWSRLNSSRSLEHQKEYQLKRQELLYQVALGITLYRRTDTKYLRETISIGNNHNGHSCSSCHACPKSMNTPRHVSLICAEPVTS